MCKTVETGKLEIVFKGTKASWQGDVAVSPACSHFSLNKSWAKVERASVTRSYP